MSSPDSTPIYSNLGNDADMRELIEEFVGNLQERVNSLKSAVQASDLSEVVRLAHQLKGSSGGYGFDVIGAAAASLESAAKAANAVADVAREISELTSLCQRATAAPLS